MLLVTVLMFNTFFGLFDTISYAEEDQDVCLSEVSETNEIEESMEKVYQEVLSSISTEEIAEENSEEFNVVDIEILSTEFQESTNDTEQYTSDEQTTESIEEQSTEKETEQNTQSIEIEISESIESTSEMATVDETESISETEIFNDEKETIQLDINIVELCVGEEKQINAVWKSGDIAIEDIFWTSSDNTVAKVEKGKITAVGVGEATITALASESIKDSCQVKVAEKESDNANDDLTLNHSELTMEIGDCEQLIASINGEETDYQDIIWESNDEDVAYVEKGYVYAISTGKTTIMASVEKNNQKVFCEIHVNGLVRRKARTSAVDLNSGYNAAAALRYAEAHWNDGVGKCAQFVSECIKSGGINVYNVSCTALRSQLINSNLVTEHTVSLSSGYLDKSALSGKLEPGDVVMYYCSAETDGKPYVHVVLCNGFDSDGRMKAYAHNSAKDGKSGMRYAQCGYCKNSIKTAHILHFNGNNGQFQNVSPIGYLDEIKVSDDSITIRGWARDDDDSNRAVEIIMEVGGNTYTTTANQYRPDVGSHGYEATFKVNCYGAQTVNVYAMDADIKQKFLLQNGNRNVTIQRPFKIEYEVSQVEFAYGDSRRISFAFQADGVAQLDIATGDGRIAQARLESIDWNKGVGYVNITSDCAVGRTDLTIFFLDGNRNKIYRKSIPITVTGQYDIKFSPVFNYVRETEECLVNFKVAGNGASSIFYDISDTSIAADMGWHNGGYNQETGEGCIAVRGVKEGTTNLIVKLWNVNGDIICEKACVIRVMEGADIFFSDKKMKVDKGSSKSQKATYKGYGVTDVTVEAITPDIAEAAIINNDKSKKEVEIVVTGHKTGTASFLFYLWDATGKQAGYRSLRVRIEEPFDILLDDNFHMWKGDARAIYFLINGSYSGAFKVSYEIEDGDDVVEITGSDGDENDGRRVFLKALDSGMATLYIRIWGTEKDTLLYEKSIFITVFELNVSPSNKTAYVEESFQIDSVCAPVTPADLKLNYVSSDDTVASISSNGLVTTKKTGKTTITVTGTTSKKQYSVVIQLTVVEKEVNVTEISVFPTSKEMTVGDILTLDVSFIPSNATNTNVTYVSSNTAVAVVDRFGRITAAGVGESKIIVTSNDGGKKASCNIVVKPKVIASGKTGDLNWKITDEKGDYTLTISGNGAMADYSGSETKNEPEWYPYNEKLKHLVLEEGITRIGRSAFSCCESLCGELKLPSSIRVIGQEAFYDCIGFGGTLQLPNNIECIEAGAFNRCSGFTGDIVIPDGIEDIREDVFAGCSGFNGSLNIPASVKTIRAGAFSQCTRLSGTLKLPNGLISIGLDAFRGCCQLSGNLILPETLEKIGGSAFNGCSGFTGNLILPESLTEIRSYAFGDCSGFVGDIMIPDSVSEISEGIFYNCTGLNGTLKLPREAGTVGMCAFTNTRFHGMVSIPKSVTAIKNEAFYGIPELTVYFEGDAPEYIKPQNSYWASFSSDVQIYYNPDMSGWSSPKWNGYAAEPVSADTPFDIPVEGIKLGVSEEYLSLGDSIVLDYWFVPENTTERDVVWESSDSSVITVDENGLVKAVGYGEALITVKTKNFKYSQCCEVLVMEQSDPTLYVKFDEDKPWMWVGETKTLKFRCGGRCFAEVGQAVYDPATAEFVDWGEMKYTTEGNGVHTQRHETRSMSIRGIGSGKTNVAVQLYDGRANLIYQDSMELTVVDLVLSEYYIEVKEGDTSDKLQISTYPEIAMPLQVVYKSSDETVVKVNEKGELEALKSGTAIITVTSLDGIISKRCDVVVYKEGTIDKEATQLTVPSASIENGSCVEKGTKLVLTCTEPEVDIYYTLDGSEPNKMSSIYTQPIEIVDDITTIKAFAAKEGYDDSEIITLTYSIKSSDNNLDDTDVGDVLIQDIPAGGIPDGLWIAGVTDQMYTGMPIKPSVRVYDYKTKLTEKQDYTISYKNNINVNDATNESKAPSVMIQAKGNYSGKETVTFQILAKDINSIDFDIADITVNPNKKVQKPVPAVIFKGKRLSNKKDFAVTYPDTFAGAYKEKGTYSIKILGKGNYTGERTINFTITDNNLITKANVSKIGSQQYTGKALKPTVQVKYAKTILRQGKDYELAYRDNIEIGTATVIIKGKGDYSGQKAVSFKIIGASISKGKVVGLSTPSTFTGSEIIKNFFLVVSVDGNQRTLKEGQDYIVKYQNNKKAGNATLVLTGINGYSGTLKKTFKINAYDLQTDANKKIRYSKDLSVAYAKNGSCPDPVIYFDKIKLEKGKDYSLSYKNNKAVNAGGNSDTAPTIIIKGKGNFTGTLPITFAITSQNLSNLTLTANDKAYKNRANIFTTSIKITDTNGKILSAGKDYDKNSIVYTYVDAVKLENGVSKKAGDNVEKTDIIPANTKIQVSVTAKTGGNYKGTATGVYRIIKSDIKNAKVLIPAQTYTGKAIVPAKSDITVTVGGTKLAESEFEIVSCTNNIKKGKASITIKGKGNYGGTKTIKFTIKSKGFFWWWRK